ncbi:hypothetical protein A3C87_01470 [Candidatus Kaiserbacteria bacterium RIFCSPHIGHO2_02_FULL_49_34]|uniref:Response regulatory domain-containing protein n=1 Tax=Candidatus Kaiserbacteria bacterium RIFCSPHIGHO2_02_FULL_49_34 TaxID=1798491 RepID=A0A1F6DIK8_9BACT|nr:MAG: hypothetical protein A3C87_01470 [Candidatus Kaiserbacteria bacterium RIFCSPHIGHO2_02_FULL_49_34]
MTTNAPWVLVVEDDSFVNKAYQTKFAFEEIPAQFALDGESALDMLREAGSKLPAVVLLDLMMPGMNGFEVLEQMKGNAKWKDVPVIILSNLGQEEDRERGLKLGAVDYLVKADTKIADIVTKINVYRNK